VRDPASSEASLAFRHYLAKEIEERIAFRRQRERQVEPVLEFLTACSERLVAHLNRAFLFELYERSFILQSVLTRDAFYAEVAPLGLNRAGARSLLPSFFRALAAAPDGAVRSLIYRVWEEVMTGTPSNETVEMIDQMRRALVDYIVRGQELAVPPLEPAEYRGIEVSAAPAA
jgi:hypothetical protein